MLNIKSATNGNAFEIVMLQFKNGTDIEKQKELMQTLNAIIKSMRGFKARDYFYSEENKYWIDFLIWETIEDAQKATESIAKNPDAGIIFSQIDEKSLIFSHYQLMGGTTL